MITIPLQPVANQSLNVTLAGQNVEALIYSTLDGRLLINVESNGERVATGVACLDAVPMIRNQYLGFIGNLIWLDTQGTSDPFYLGLGDRFLLVYLSVDEYDQFFNQ